MLRFWAAAMPVASEALSKVSKARFIAIGS
jgi:hypothetical protein